MDPSLDPVFTLLRIWAEGLARTDVLRERLRQLPEASECDKQIGLSLLACGDETVLPGPARELAEALQQDANWLRRQSAQWQVRPLLRQQLGIQIAKAAALLHGEPQMALLLYDQALLLMPELAAAWFFRGLLWQALGQLPKAVHDLSKAARLQADWAPAWQEAARTLLLAGEPEQALALVAEGLEHLPAEAGLWLAQGNLQQAIGQLEAAASAYQHCLELNPQQAGVWSNLGLVCQQQLQPTQALACYNRALAIDPGLAELWNNLATLHLDSGQAVEAESCLNRCLQLVPNYYPAWVNRALLAATRGQNLLALQLFEKARQLDQHQPAAWVEAARLLLDQDLDHEAYHLLEQGIALVTQPGPLEMMLGRNLILRHQFTSGQALIQQAIKHVPERIFWRFLAELGAPNAWLCRPYAERMAYLTKLAQVLPRWAAQPFSPQLYLHESSYLIVESLWGLAYLDSGPFINIKSLYNQCFQLAAERPARHLGRGPLRLGVVVTPGHEGIFFKLSARLLAALPASSCEILLLGDPIQLKGSNLPTLQLAPKITTAAAQLRALDLDMIYYWEVGSDMLNFFLPFFQPAAIQFTSWGTPATTGHPAMHYYLSSRQIEPPDAASHYSETLMLMDELPTFFEDPAPAAGQANRTQLGLPATGTLYLCLNNPLKFCPEFLTLMAQILAQDPSGHLVLLTSRQPWINQAIHPALAVLEPFQERVHWRVTPVPRAEFLNLMKVADIGLDTLVCSGGQVSHEALALGLPVITLPGSNANTRLTLSRWNQLDLTDGVVQDTADYLRLALELSRQPERRAKLHERILARRDRLLNRQPAVDQFADLIWKMAVDAGIRN